MTDGAERRLLSDSPLPQKPKAYGLDILQTLRPFALSRSLQPVQEFGLRHFEIFYSATFATVSFLVSQWCASDVVLGFSESVLIRQP